MMTINKLERFKNGSIVLLPANDDVYTMLMQWCEKQGMRWNSGAMPTTIGGLPKRIGVFRDKKKVLLHDSVSWLKYKGYKVVGLGKNDFKEEIKR